MKLPSGEVECQLIVPKTNTKCGHKPKTPATTNLEMHCRSHENELPDWWKDYKIKMDVYKSGMDRRQTLLTNSVSIKTHKYNFSKPEERRKARKLDQLWGGVVAGCCGVSGLTSEDPLFKAWAEEACPMWEPPSKSKALRLAVEAGDQVLDAVMEKVKKAVERMKLIVCGIDLWTDAQGRPFLGVTAYFYDVDSGKADNVALSLPEMPSPHNAAHVMEVFADTLQSRGISGLVALPSSGFRGQGVGTREQNKPNKKLDCKISEIFQD